MKNIMGLSFKPGEQQGGSSQGGREGLIFSFWIDTGSQDWTLLPISDRNKPLIIRQSIDFYGWGRLGGEAQEGSCLTVSWRNPGRGSREGGSDLWKSYFPLNGCCELCCYLGEGNLMEWTAAVGLLSSVGKVWVILVSFTSTAHYPLPPSCHFCPHCQSVPPPPTLFTNGMGL